MDLPTPAGAARIARTTVIAADEEPFFRDIIEALAVAIILSLTVKQFAIEAYKVPTGSMEPTIHGHPVQGDRILVNKLAYVFRDPRRWEIIVFQFPNNRRINYIKRIVGDGGKKGEALFIRGGDIYRAPFGHFLDDAQELWEQGILKICRKPLEVQDDMFARYPLVGESERRFDSEQAFVSHWTLPSRQLNPSATWNFDSGMVAEAKGAASFVHFRAAIRDERRGVSHLEDRSAVGKYHVGDVRLEIVAKPLREGGYLLLKIRDPYHSQELLARLAIGRRESSLSGLFIAGERVAALDDVRLSPDSNTKIAFSNFDNRITLHIDGELVAQADYRHPPMAQERLFRVERATAFGVEDARVVFSEAQAYRDLYYRGHSSSDIPAGHYFVMGDNSAASKDSREWRRISIHPEGLGGRTINGDLEAVVDPNDLDSRLENPFVKDGRQYFVDEYGNVLDITDQVIFPVLNDEWPWVPRRLISGRAFAIFWPWARLGVAR